MRWLLIILVLKAVVLGLVMGLSGIGLAPDEAQYWTWSQQLDWGYYSKPPGIAWQIWATSSIFGNTVFGVRFGALVIGLLIALAVYAVARAADLNKNTAFWSAIVFSFCPLGVYLSFVATTDAGMVLFLTLAAAIAVKGVKEGPNYMLIGLCIFFGALYKWTAFIFWPWLFIYLIFFKSLRKWSILGGLAISLLALLPSLYWNASHEWATFKHVGKTVAKSNVGNFFDFLASQIGLISPVFFVLLVMSYFFLRKANRGLTLAAGFPIIALLYLSVSIFKKMQPNWALFAYPAGLPLVAWVGCEKLKRGKKWLHIGTWLSILIVSALFAIPRLQKTWDLPYKFNPFRHSMGWEKLSAILPHDNFLFADKYQAASLLSFYGPKQKRAYFFNISQTRKNQFSFWPQMSQNEVGKTGYFVVLENTDEKASSWYQQHYLKRLAPYFEHVTYQGAYPLFSVAGKGVKYAFIFECRNYSGAMPQETIKY